MSNLVDTLLNIEVFAFIGLLIWLYVKPSPAPEAGEVDPTCESEFANKSK